MGLDAERRGELLSETESGILTGFPQALGQGFFHFVFKPFHAGNFILPAQLCTSFKSDVSMAIDYILTKT